MLVLAPLAFTVFSALLGVRVNLRFPRLDWTSEVQPVKQGVSGIISMGIAFAAAVAPAAAMLLAASLSPELVLLVYLAALIALSALLSLSLVKKGDKLLSKLSN